MPSAITMVEVRCVLPGVVVQRGERVFVASCPVLDVVSQGDTQSEAKKNLGEAVCLFLISCFERGTLDEVLRRAGFSPSTESGKGRPHKIEAPYFPLKVTLPFSHPVLLPAS